MEPRNTWYLVGDASRARIFVRRQANKQLELVREFYHPESRLANQELVTDRPGRVQQSGGSGGGGGPGGQNMGTHSAMAPHTSPKTVEHESFAHELATALHKGLTDNAYQSLVLVAGPQFLGLLRSTIDAQVQKHVKASLDKDYTHFNVQELDKHLTAQFDGFVP